MSAIGVSSASNVGSVGSIPFSQAPREGMTQAAGQVRPLEATVTPSRVDFATLDSAAIESSGRIYSSDSGTAPFLVEARDTFAQRLGERFARPLPGERYFEQERFSAEAAFERQSDLIGELVERFESVLAQINKVVDGVSPTAAPPAEMAQESLRDLRKTADSAADDFVPAAEATFAEATAADLSNEPPRLNVVL